MLRRICVGLVDDGEMNLEGIETIFERDHRFDGVRWKVSVLKMNMESRELRNRKFYNVIVAKIGIYHNKN